MVDLNNKINAIGKTAVRVPGYLQITRECNNACIFCSNPDFNKLYSLDEAMLAVDEFCKLGINHIILTGGEPTTCGFLLEIIDYIKSKNLTFSMISNGVNFSDLNFTQKISNVGLSNIHISMHSFDGNVADRLSLREGHFKKSLLGISNCLKSGIVVNINSTINSVNGKTIDKFVSFMIKTFPKIKHYVFNFLDPGDPDGRNQSRAKQNPYVVARYSNIELSLSKAVSILKKNNKTFRIERVPLCYMKGFGEYSTETRKIVKDESYVCSFVPTDGDDNIRKVPATRGRVKFDCCKVCSLNSICVGVQEEYVNIHGSQEFHPVFENLELVVKKIIGDGNKYL